MEKEVTSLSFSKLIRLNELCGRVEKLFHFTGTFDLLSQIESRCETFCSFTFLERETSKYTFALIIICKELSKYMLERVHEF